MRTIGSIKIPDKDIFKGGYATIYKSGKKYTYKCFYTGKTALTGGNVNIVRNVLRGKYGNANTRITKLIDAGYYPVAVQQKVDNVTSTAKDIISGKVDYGKNETRIANLDKKFGKGYGQLIQDYINVLLGVKESV